MKRPVNYLRNSEVTVAVDGSLVSYVVRKLNTNTAYTLQDYASALSSTVGHVRRALIRAMNEGKCKFTIIGSWVYGCAL